MSNATHRIGASTRITGSVVGSGDLTVAGAIEGNIQLDGSLMLEATSQLVGDVAATSIRLGGKITGNGIGLAIVKHIMAHHRGGLAVETLLGQGTAFGVWLPAAREA
jgi:cytoskeletal protein CcmA (bactofilin family)